MKIKKSEIVAVAALPSQYPPEDMWEVAFSGRSNVGKSSLLNLITGRRNLAKVSGNPGKTRTINFYEINGEFRIVDLPGYGYAKVSKSLSKEWGPMMENYLKNRPNLAGVVQLVDIRHEPSALDKQMHIYLKHYGLNGIVVATKADKISVNHICKHLNLIRKGLAMEDEERIIPISALKKRGQDHLMEAIEALLSE